METLYDKYMDEMRQNISLMKILNGIINVLLTDLPDRVKLTEIKSILVTPSRREAGNI